MYRCNENSLITFNYALKYLIIRHITTFYINTASYKMGCPFCKARDEPCVDNYQKAPLTEIDIFDMAEEACKRGNDNSSADREKNSGRVVRSP